MSGLEKRGRTDNAGVGLRRLVIRFGVEPDRDARQSCPQPCERQSPRQDRFHGRTCVSWKRTADGSEAQKPKPFSSPIGRLSDLHDSNWRPVTPTKINRGGRGGIRGTWARSDRNVANDLAASIDFDEPSRVAARDHPHVGQNLRRAEPQERRRSSGDPRAATRRQRSLPPEGRNRSTGWAARQNGLSGG
jgi:hypothetical protein